MNSLIGELSLNILGELLSDFMGNKWQAIKDFFKGKMDEGAWNKCLGEILEGAEGVIDRAFLEKLLSEARDFYTSEVGITKRRWFRKKRLPEKSNWLTLLTATRSADLMDYFAPVSCFANATPKQQRITVKVLCRFRSYLLNYEWEYNVDEKDKLLLAIGTEMVEERLKNALESYLDAHASQKVDLRRFALMEACPNCGSMNITFRDSSTENFIAGNWRCGDCGFQFPLELKDPEAEALKARKLDEDDIRKLEGTLLDGFKNILNEADRKKFFRYFNSVMRNTLDRLREDKSVITLANHQFACKFLGEMIAYLSDNAEMRLLDFFFDIFDDERTSSITDTYDLGLVYLDIRNMCELAKAFGRERDYPTKESYIRFLLLRANAADKDSLHYFIEQFFFTDPEATERYLARLDAKFKGAPAPEDPFHLMFDGKLLSDYRGTLPEDGELKLPAGVEEIAEGVFTGMVGLKCVVLPKELKRIGARAFAGCEELKRVEGGAGVTEIAEAAFFGTALEKAEFSSLLEVGDLAFCGCPLIWKGLPVGLTSIGACALSGNTVEKGNKHFTIRDGLLIEGDRLILVPRACTKLAVPDDIKEIAAGAAMMSKLENLIMGRNLISIGDFAFAGCSSLEDVFTGKCSGLQIIGAHAFDGCQALPSKLIIPKPVTFIGERAFAGCPQLTSVELPESVKKIGKAAFADSTEAIAHCYVSIPDNDEWGENLRDIRTVA